MPIEFLYNKRQRQRRKKNFCKTLGIYVKIIRDIGNINGVYKGAEYESYF